MKDYREFTKNERETIDDIDQVYGSQIPHRVIADTPDGYRIMTPTDAKQKGFKYRFI